MSTPEQLSALEDQYHAALAAHEGAPSEESAAAVGALAQQLIPLRQEYRRNSGLRSSDEGNDATVVVDG